MSDQPRLPMSRYRLDNVRTWVSEHPVFAVFALAFIARAAVGIGLHVGGLQIQPDEEVFWRIAGDLHSGTTADWTDYEAYLFRASSSLVIPLSWLQAIPGPSDLYARLMIGLTGAGTAAVTAKIGILVRDRATGLIAGLLVALWPSQILFSTFIHRDAPVWLGLATMALLVVVLHRSQSRRQVIFAWIGSTGMLAVLFTLRPAMGTMAGLALVGAGLLLSNEFRAVAAVGSLVSLILVPLVLGFGPAGKGVVGSKKFVDPKDFDVPIATDVADPSGADGATSENAEAEQSSEDGEAEQSSEKQVACTRIARPYAPTDPGRIVLRTLDGLVPVMFGPLPWRDVCSVWGSLAKFQTIVWTLLFGVAGAAIVKRRVPFRLLSYGLLLAGGLWVTMAYFERTVGTAFRHRQQMLWVLALLAACVIADWRTFTSSEPLNEGEPDRELHRTSS